MAAVGGGAGFIFAPPRAMLALLLALSAFFVAGCDEARSRAAAEDQSAPEGSREIRAELEPVGGSGTAGTVAFVPAGGGTEVRLSLRGLPDPEAVYVGAIYEGTCEGETGGRGGAVYRFVHGGGHAPAEDEGVVQTLTSVESGAGGEGASVTPLPDPVGELLSDGPRYVDIHDEGEGALACADLPGDRSYDA